MLLKKPLKSHLFAYLRFCAFPRVSLCLLVLLLLWCFWCFWCVQNVFVRKNKEFKTALITSFILLLNFIPLRAWIFESQYFLIIKILFNYHHLFQLSWSFLIITIFFITIFFITIFSNLFRTCDTIFMKIHKFHHLTHIFYRQNITKIFCQFHMFLIYDFHFEFFLFCV